MKLWINPSGIQEIPFVLQAQQPGGPAVQLAHHLLSAHQQQVSREGSAGENDHLLITNGCTALSYSWYPTILVLQYEPYSIWWGI